MLSSSEDVRDFFEEEEIARDHADALFEQAVAKRAAWKAAGLCEDCGAKEVRLVGAMTRYAAEAPTWYERLSYDDPHDPPPDPNPDLLLCRACEYEYTEYWNEMWNEYKRSLW